MHDEALWERALAIGTFKSDEGSRLVLAAREALGRLPAGLPDERLDAIFELFLRDARYALWPATAGLSDVHLARLAAKLSEVAPPAKHLPREIQHDLLMAAHALGPAALRHAAEFLLRVSKANHIPESLSRLKRWTKVPPLLLDALEVSFTRREAPPSILEIVPFGSGLFVLLRARPASAAVAAVMARKEAWSRAPVGGNVVAVVEGALSPIR